MNDVYTYPDYTEYDDTFTNAVEAEKQRLLGRLAARGISHIELLCLPFENIPLQNSEIINTALSQLAQTDQIRKTYEVTGEGNALIGYELTDPTTITH